MILSEREHEDMEAKMGRSTRSRYEEAFFFFDEREYFYLCVVVYNDRLSRQERYGCIKASARFVQ